MNLPANRRAILVKLLDGKGEVIGSALTSTQKCLASKMAADGLVVWIPAAYAPWSRDYQTLHLTKTGLEAYKATVVAR